MLCMIKPTLEGLEGIYQKCNCWGEQRPPSAFKAPTTCFGLVSWSLLSNQQNPHYIKCPSNDKNVLYLIYQCGYFNIALGKNQELQSSVFYSNKCSDVFECITVIYYECIDVLQVGFIAKIVGRRMIKYKKREDKGVFQEVSRITMLILAFLKSLSVNYLVNIQLCQVELISHLSGVPHNQDSDQPVLMVYPFIHVVYPFISLGLSIAP